VIDGGAALGIVVEESNWSQKTENPKLSPRRQHPATKEPSPNQTTIIDIENQRLNQNGLVKIRERNLKEAPICEAIPICASPSVNPGCRGHISATRLSYVMGRSISFMFSNDSTKHGGGRGGHGLMKKSN
jgi:hypothetical protein